MSTTETLNVYKDTYKLVNLILDNIQHLPKMHRFTLGDRLVGAAYDALEFVHRANSASSKEERATWLDKFLTNMNILKTYLRIINERNFISTKQAAGMFGIVGDIMRQAAGWKNYTEKR